MAVNATSIDTKGMIVAVMVTPANVTDRDAAREVLLRLCLEHPEITQVWADQGYSGELVTWARETLGLLLRISKRPPGQVGFKVLPRRWPAVEPEACAAINRQYLTPERPPSGEVTEPMR
jgi:Transposase DDE domain